MKFLALSLLFLAVACDTPTRARFPTAGIGSNNLVDTGVGLDQGTTTGTTNNGSNSGSTTTPTTTPGFENCTLTKNRSTADLGSVGICKSTIDETQVRFVTSISHSSSRFCVIPTFKETSTGNSMYLGDPQCVYVEAEKVYEGRLYKNSNRSSYPINGVMIMKEALLVEYYSCMDSYQKYIQYYCPGNPSYAPCVQAATNYRNSLCNNFKTKYPNNYLDLHL